MFSSSYCLSFFKWKNRRNKCPAVFNGARVEQVDEPHSASVVVCSELDAYPEPKVLSPDQLQALYERYGTFVAAGKVIGSSPCFVRQNLKNKKR